MVDKDGREERRKKKEKGKNDETGAEQEIDTEGTGTERTRLPVGSSGGKGRRSSGIQTRDSCLPKDLQSQAENATASISGSL